MNVGNNVAKVRKAHALNVMQLAARVGITRQTIYAIESGVYIPNTAIALRLAKELNVAVEDLFSLQSARHVSAECKTAKLLPDMRNHDLGRPVWLCQVGDRWIAAACGLSGDYRPPADGLIAKLYASKSNTAAIRVLVPEGDKPKHLLLAGHCPGRTVLSHYLQQSGYNLIPVSGSRRKPLDLLKQGLVHIAIDSAYRSQPEGGVKPRPGSILDTQDYVVTRYTTLEIGLAVVADNPKRIQSVRDLKRDIRFINQPIGSECRTFFDQIAGRLRLDRIQARQSDLTANGGLAAAWQVYTGKADCCLATRSTARLLGLHFVPAAERQFHLIVRKDSLPPDALTDIINTIGKPAFRRDMESLCYQDQAEPAKEPA